MRRIPGWIGPAAVVVVAFVLAELPALKQAGETIDGHQEHLFAVTVALTALGFAVFMGGILSLLMAGAAANETSLAGIKEAWRNGDWRRDAQWFRLFIVASGATMFFYGGFGLVLVLGPMPIRVLVAGVLAYVTAMIVWGFTRVSATH